jgi:uncharacterized phage-associated protein
MGDIKFEFSLEKLINAIALFWERGLADLTKLKVAKLLYFADKKHLLEYGRPILGDMYVCMDLGPVPSLALLEMNEAINQSEVSSDDYSIMHRCLRVRKPFLSKYHHFEGICPCDTSVFSQSELMVLNMVVKEYGGRTAGQLVDITHDEAPWKIANEKRVRGSRTQIPYELFFEGAPDESKKFLARLKADFCGEVISLDSDAEYSDFAGSLFARRFEHDFELDPDEVRSRANAL